MSSVACRTASAPDSNRYTSLAASADGRRLIATLANPAERFWRLPIADTPVDASAATAHRLDDRTWILSSTGPGLSRCTSRRRARATESGSSPTERRPSCGARRTRESSAAPRSRQTDVASPSRSQQRRQNPVVRDERRRDRRARGDRIARVAGRTGVDAGWTIDHVGGDRWTACRISSASHWTARRSPVAGILRRSRVVSRRRLPRVLGRRHRHHVPGKSHHRGSGSPYPFPNLTLTRGARRLRFFHGQRALVVMRGDIQHKNLWLVDLDDRRRASVDQPAARLQRAGFRYLSRWPRDRPRARARTLGRRAHRSRRTRLNQLHIHPSRYARDRLASQRAAFDRSPGGLPVLNQPRRTVRASSFISA